MVHKLGRLQRCISIANERTVGIICLTAKNIRFAFSRWFLMSMIHLRQHQHCWNGLCIVLIGEISLSHVPFGFLRAFKLVSRRGLFGQSVEAAPFLLRREKSERGHV